MLDKNLRLKIKLSENNNDIGLLYNKVVCKRREINILINPAIIQNSKNNFNRV